MKTFEPLKKHGIDIVSTIEGDRGFYVVTMEEKECIGKNIKSSRRISLSAVKDAYEKLLTIKDDSIISIKKVIDLENELFVVMEYINWITLNKYMKENYFYNEDDNLKKLKKIFINLAEAIDRLHSYGVVHADINCSNILVNEELQIKIIDFDFSIINKNDFNAKKIDILRYNSLILEYIFEQVYLHEKYYDNSDNVKSKKELFAKISTQYEAHLDSCLVVFSEVFNT